MPSICYLYSSPPHAPSNTLLMRQHPPALSLLSYCFEMQSICYGPFCCRYKANDPRYPLSAIYYQYALLSMCHRHAINVLADCFEMLSICYGLHCCHHKACDSTYPPSYILSVCFAIHVLSTSHKHAILLRDAINMRLICYQPVPNALCLCN